MLPSAFHPVVERWFAGRYGEPTAIQAEAWPRIAAGEHLLVTAPTGSGKTLTAFLWALHRFAEGSLANGATRVLYVSPLKALNNDIKENLLQPLEQLKAAFAEAGEDFPEVRVMTRSGDTDPQTRQRMLRRPPEILVTTPESLNLMLSSAGGQRVLQALDTVILDEIHSVVDSKRGAFLMAAVERLVPLSGEFQRIALSATVNPLAGVAAFVGGYARDGSNFTARQVGILASTASKRYEITIRYPQAAAERGEDENLWDYLAIDLLKRIEGNQSTLVFVNSRALCEKLTFKINNAAGGLVAYAHHGSLARDIRGEVERRLKAGELQAIVATSSLELGIDIGALDEVILVQSPGSIASAIQRIGRAGHQVGAASRCTIYPTHAQDFLEAAVLADAVIARDLEPASPVHRPLDVLSQVIVSMTGTATWDLDDLYLELRRSLPYQQLSRQEFDLVVQMLLGRYSGHQIRELKPRVSVDKIGNTISARKGALLSLYLGGGVIPDRGYYQLRHETDNARIGDLDEEFVWEAKIGQVFSLGTQTWQVKKITHNDVIVGPGKASAGAPPFWRAEPISRSFHYAQRIGEFLEQAEGQLADGTLKAQLMARYHTEPEVAEEVVSYLTRQREHTKAGLPHRHHLLVEKVRTGPMGVPGYQVVLHTGWGAAVNRPFALALEGAWQQQYQEQPEVFVGNESVIIQLPDQLPADELVSLVPPADIEALLRIRLEGSGFFGARFRENAGRALLLSKGRFNERKPLWMNRLQSQKLLEAVLRYEDFPILLETWRTCLQDEFDLVNLRLVLDELHTRQITLTEVETATPSPFAESAAWDQVTSYMYMSDAPKASKSSKLSGSLLQEVVFDPSIRPAVTRQVIDDFERDWQRLGQGYAPQSLDELTDWVKDRWALPAQEWRQLEGLLDFPTETQLLSWTSGSAPLLVATENLAEIQALQDGTEPGSEALATFLGNWLQYYGPLTLDDISARLGLAEAPLVAALDELLESEMLISGQLVAASDQSHYCDSANYEYLLRSQRQAQRPQVEPRQAEGLAAFMYQWQTRFGAQDPVEQTFETLERLRGLPLAAELWEAELLPARVPGYRSGHLDALFAEGELEWLGTGDGEVTFGFKGEAALFQDEAAASELLPDPGARYDLFALADRLGASSRELTNALWQEVWQGSISNDAMTTLRAGIDSKFTAAKLAKTRDNRVHRGAMRRARGAMTSTGSWYTVARASQGEDLLDQQELAKERARLLLNRYGVVFRELTARELPAFSWRSIYRALRLMELGGEVVSGRFFTGIAGPQYMTPAAVRLFTDRSPPPAFLINALDPVSPAGLGLGLFPEALPRRVKSTHLVMKGEQLLLVSARQGKALTIYPKPEEALAKDALALLHQLIYRDFRPLKRLTIEEINGVAAASSDYLPLLEDEFAVLRDYKSVIIERELTKGAI